MFSTSLCVPAVQTVLWHCTNTALGYKSKVPHKVPALENQLTEEMEAALRRNLMFVLYPKES